MKKTGLMIMAAVLLTGAAFSQDVLRKKHYNLDKGIALDGYDAVAYFKQNKAVEGKKEFAVSDQGVIYYFSNAENKQDFLKNAAKYEPQYGGWCAYAMGANGEKVSVDPKTFKILNGKLYLFYHSWLNNTLTKWNKDEAALKTKADKNWLDIFK
ncbi:YHS domain protein [Ferruginibacter sp. HRS2-29]|nr:YHS domain protein [Ferruginibacter sp. HRS2-29]